MIHHPITLGPEKHVSDATQLMEKYHISGIPIVDEMNKLIGILTNRDLRFEPNLNLKISEVMTKNNLRTATLGTTLEEAESFCTDIAILDKGKIIIHGKTAELTNKFPETNKLEDIYLILTGKHLRD